MRTSHRPRRGVTPRRLRFLRPFVRYSRSRDAFVLRIIGNRWGPVWRITLSGEPPEFETALSEVDGN
jgi:hypothetical protein